jgi:hypothetical protein
VHKPLFSTKARNPVDRFRRFHYIVMSNQAFDETADAVFREPIGAMLP